MTKHNNEHALIIDIGKTHVKLHILNSTCESVFSKQMSNTVDTSGPFPSARVEDIWDWLCSAICEASSDYFIAKMTITTHGATAALIDNTKQGTNGLVLPVLDYEYTDTFSNSDAYQTACSPFEHTYSPSLPAGLNLGRQLFWLKQHYPDSFGKATDILMYPQYWAWRFTGARYSEITSLGCHTDLWSIENNDYSALVDTLDCRDKFPPMAPAWQSCGVILPYLASQLGLPETCEFFSGIHDSNASFLRYRLAQEGTPFTVISTGTWTILMASQVELSNLDASRDMLANIDALGSPIACARFMGGREFEAICEQAGSWLGEQFGLDDIQKVIDSQVFALPDFSDGSGPFGGRKAEFIGQVDKVSGIALATLYCALMIDHQLDNLDAQGDIYIEGAFLKNPLLCALVNQLRSHQQVLLSKDATGTVLGAAYLTCWEEASSQIDTEMAAKVDVVGLTDYKAQWLQQLADHH